MEFGAWRCESAMSRHSTRGQYLLLASGFCRLHTPGMSTVTIAVPDPLDAALSARVKAVGAQSREEYLLDTHRVRLCGG